ncbi:uncharacterized protein BDR25DRAFT_356838 [Lindgomyces ingoldianus]|uniref:Uncharacterized protein n=1 Tax=Lindgomyces ingoldianus TaxID=673940 RepID=A0ACB6QSL8_9PLEO|nr:uncharacterized protein BDR25DRAFT_356838 [Lindgomyces ingoldianus]KAF2469072.1 hypothetical protein BDR25DRAFT_356838 [Lindgomyces ingoldianus]
MTFEAFVDESFLILSYDELRVAINYFQSNFRSFSPATQSYGVLSVSSFRTLPLLYQFLHRQRHLYLSFASQSYILSLFISSSRISCKLFYLKYSQLSPIPFFSIITPSIFFHIKLHLIPSISFMCHFLFLYSIPITAHPVFFFHRPQARKLSISVPGIDSFILILLIRVFSALIKLLCYCLHPSSSFFDGGPPKWYSGLIILASRLRPFIIYPRSGPYSTRRRFARSSSPKSLPNLTDSVQQFEFTPTVLTYSAVFVFFFFIYFFTS